MIRAVLTYTAYAAAFLIVAAVVEHPAPVVTALRSWLLDTFPVLRGCAWSHSAGKEEGRPFPAAAFSFHGYGKSLRSGGAPPRR